MKINKLFNFKFLLILIVLVAAILRFYNIGSNPSSLTWDETAWGYNAYSLGLDGKDEFGRFLPHDYLESFGDYKPPMYAYLDVIPVKIFGLNEFSTRFPSALFGTLTVLLSFFLVIRIFWKSKNKEKYALLSALFLAISPWHILLSRAAFEANVASFFIILGVFGFLAAVQDKRRYLIVSAISFALSMYIFNTARVVSPLLVILLVVSFRKDLLKIKKEVVISAIVGLLIFLPTLGFLLTPQANLRFKEVNIFSDPQVVTTSNQEIANDGNAFWSKIIHNRRLLYSVSFVKHYFDNLNPEFLFTKGDGNPKFSTQDNGQMYIWDLPFFIAGILFLLKRKEGNWWLIPLWLIIGIIPAATARETPHALRIETTLPTFQIFIAYGFVELLEKISKYKKQIITVAFLLLFANFVYFAHTYFVHYPVDYSGEWQYGYKESIAYVDQNINKYKNIYITEELGRPYIYYLFYNKVDPKIFRKDAVVVRDAFGFVNVEKLGKLNFVSAPSASSLRKNNSLYITDKYNVPKDAKILKTFYLLNGQPILIAYTL
jgi:4-amino-4-deoxy-L-arabinose transferase-like glycosyltransferase